MFQSGFSILYNRGPMTRTAVDVRMDCSKVRSSRPTERGGDVAVVLTDAGRLLLPALSILAKESEDSP